MPRPRSQTEDLVAARRWADEAVSITTGWYSALALAMRARVAIAAGESEQAERDAHDALAMRRRMRGVPVYPVTFWSVSPRLAGRGRQSPAKPPASSAQLTAFGNASGAVRFKVWDADYEASVARAARHYGRQGL